MKNYLSDKAREWRYRADDYDPTTYRDPDFSDTEGSKELYSDLLAFVDIQQETMGIRPFGRCPSMQSTGTYYRLVASDFAEEKRFGSDYIGPSRSWAEGFEDIAGARFSRERVGEFLTWSRTLGGHMLWPSRKNSINQQRGGWYTYDRIDLTLEEIRNWMFHPDAKSLYKPSLRFAIELDKDWFNLFKQENDCSPQEWFASFVSFFQLEGYTNDNYEVMSLTHNSTDAILERSGCLLSASYPLSDTYADTIGNYSQYVSNQKAIVVQRTHSMERILEKG